LDAQVVVLYFDALLCVVDAKSTRINLRPDFSNTHEIGRHGILDVKFALQLNHKVEQTAQKIVLTEL
jgi:hypothetical protein